MTIMKKRMSRRTVFLTSLGIAASSLLAGCVTTKGSKSGAVTLDVAKVSGYIKAGLNAADLVVTVLSMHPQMRSYADKAKRASDQLSTAAGAFHQAVGDKLTVSYDATSTKTLVDSIMVTLNTLVSVLGEVWSLAGGNLFPIGEDTIDKIKLTYDAMLTITSIFTAMLAGTYNATFDYASRRRMSEQQALAALNGYHFSI